MPSALTIVTFSFPGTGSSPFRLAFIKQLVVAMSFHFVLLYVCRFCLHLLCFLSIFHISGSPWYKTDSTQDEDGDRGGVCLLAGGPLDYSQSSIFP